MSAVTASPTFGVTVTVIAYVVGQIVHRKLAWLPPLVTTCGLLIALLVLGRIPIDDYKRGGDLVSFFLGPATIALGVPLFRNFGHIRRHAAAVLTSVTVGGIVGIGVAELCVWLAGGSEALLRTMLAKGVTTPIAIELARQARGQPELAAVFTVLAGLFGSIVGPWMLRRCGVRSDLAIGLAIGTGSHGIGTARVVRESELQGGASGLAMALCGIVTSIVIAVVAAFINR